MRVSMWSFKCKLLQMQWVDLWYMMCGSVPIGRPETSCSQCFPVKEMYVKF